MSSSEWKNIWVYLEQVDGVIETVSWEILGKGRELADRSGEKLIAVILGHSIGDQSREALQRGADKVLVGDDPRDIEAGRAAGTRTAAAHYGYGSAELTVRVAGDSLQVHHPVDLIDLVRQSRAPLD